MRAVDLAPLVEQRHDLVDLPVEQAVHRAATRGLVGKLVGGPPAQPPVHADLAQLQDPAGVSHRPALPACLLEQVQQPGLGGLIHPGRDPATQPQRPFPSISMSLTAISLSASPSRAASALAASSSRSRLACCTPGRDSASAASAPSLATVRSRMIVERSTPTRSAASLMVVSPRTSCSQISYFCDGDRNRLARRPSRSLPRSCSVMIRPSSSGQQPEQMLSDPNPVLYREVRRKPGPLEARTVLEGRAERPALQQLRELPRFPRTQLTPPHRSGSSMMSSPLPEHRTAPVGRPVKARHPDTAAPRSRLGDDVVVTTGGPHRGAKLRDNGATGVPTSSSPAVPQA